MFTIDVLTLFPEVFAPFVGLSIIGRAVENGVVDIRYHHVLDALTGAERADDQPFGGGPGMVLRIEPLARILDPLLEQGPAGERRTVIVPAPGGRPFKQADALRFARENDRLIFVCGHYEGIDERLGEPLPRAGVLPGRLRSHGRRAARAGDDGCHGPPTGRNDAGRIAGERIVLGWRLGLSGTTPGPRFFAGLPCLRSCSRGTMPRSRPGGANRAGCAPAPAGRT